MLAAIFGCIRWLLANRSRVPMAALTAVLVLCQGPAGAAVDSKGTDFWVMFNQNNSTATSSLFITGDVATTGTVTVPGLGFSQAFSVTPGVVTTVVLPTAVTAAGIDNIENKGVRVVANAEVTVYGLNRQPFTTDAFLGIPVDALGIEYIHVGYNGFTSSQLGIVSPQNGTVVTITPSNAAGSGRAAGVPYSITLNQGQTYQLRGDELTGSIIRSTLPVAVFGGHQCANVPTTASACDHLVEQLPPTNTWGKAFVTVPLATRLLGDTFRIVASTNNTVVSLNGAVVATLQRGQFHERIITTSSVITSTQAVLVLQYSNGSTFDGVTSDPFMMLIPPFEQFLSEYTVTTPASGFATNFINVVAPTASIGLVKLDNVIIPASSFTPIPGSTFSGARLPVSLGSHSLSSPQVFGAFVYGFDSFDSYGYPAGQAYAAVAVVARITLTPPSATGPINAQHCVDAAVSDQFGSPVSSVRVDFGVTGANITSGFSNTAASGVARFCYVGTNLGLDTIVASVGTLSATATKLWTPASTIGSCDVDGNASVDTRDLALIRAGVGQTATPNDPRDGDGNGLIDVRDVRACTLRCTRASCAIN